MNSFCPYLKQVLVSSLSFPWRDSYSQMLYSLKINCYHQLGHQYVCAMDSQRDDAWGINLKQIARKRLC